MEWLKVIRTIRITCFLILILTFSSYAKEQPVLIAVADGSSSVSQMTIRYVKKCGMKAEQVKSSKINISKYDGLIIPGGPDVTPSLYHAKKSSRTGSCSLGKDKFQIAIIRKFAAAGKPILGICRGCQLINVAYGGTLKQHVGYRRGRIKIYIKTNSLMRSIFGAHETTYHHHHQAVGKLGKGIIATMTSRNGTLIEGIRHETLPIYAVQWHPERSGSSGIKLGKEFKKICLAYRYRSQG